MFRAVAIGLALAVLGVPATAAAAPELDAGALRAEVHSNPWHLRLTDARGRQVLNEDVARGLGFRLAGGWEHATRVVRVYNRGADYHAVLATTDPGGRRIDLRLVREADGVIAMQVRVSSDAGVEAIGLGFDTDPGERYLGFGERSNAFEQGGGVVENYVSDGPYQAAEYPLINLFTPAWGLRDGHPESTYYPVPWLLSTAGYGVLVDDPRTSYYRIGADGPGSWSVEVDAAPEGEAGTSGAAVVGPVRFEFFAGPKPADALRRFVDQTGNQPKPAAPWLLGAWYQADDSESDELARQRAAGVPVSVLQTYTHYLPCGDQNGREAAERERIDAAHAAGVAVTTYFNPMICTAYQPAYDQAAAAGALTADSTGAPYLYRYGADVDQNFRVSQFDFFTDAGQNAYRNLLDEAIDDGYDGWMEDFGEYTPLDSVSDPGGAGYPGTYAHNLYAARYHCTANLATVSAPRPIIRYQRSGWTGTAPCAQVVWGGDPTTTFGFDGLRSAVTQALSAGTSGIGIWGSDIGGFFALGANQLTPELLTRWVQLGAGSVVMRTEANGVAVPPRDRPQVIDPDQLANWRFYAALHTQLYPYLSGALKTYRRTGMPPMRALALARPKEPGALTADDEYLLGRDLLVAPVLEAGATERALYVPRGRWIDLWRSAGFRPGKGLHLGAARVLSGGRELTVPAPIDQLPVLVRAGAVLAMLPGEVDTLASYGDDVAGLDSLADVRDRMRLIAYPRGDSSSRFGNGETLRSSLRADRWTLEVDGKRRRRYLLQASLPKWGVCAVAVDGESLARSRWEFDRAARVLRASFSARPDARLTVEAC